MKKMMLMLFLAGAVTVLLPACNTVAGAGRDIQGAGESVEDSARRN